MTATHTSPRDVADVSGRRLTPWAFTGVATGALGVVATLITDIHPLAWADRSATVDIVDDLQRGMAHASVVLGYTTVVGLLVLAALWRRHVEPRTESSTASRVVPLGFVAAAGALAIGYGYKGMLAIYLPGGINADLFHAEALYVMYVLNDFGSFVGWLGVVVAAGAVAWMALRERTISRWIGVVSLVPVLAAGGMLVMTGLPGFAGVVGPLWLAAASLGLAFGRSPIVR